ncbi:MAG: acyl-CoA thioesterase [Flavobacteriales bacterium]|nr:acyl-CoA thioesterase [Flavobacteriales bacterium]
MTSQTGTFRSRITLRWADIDANFHLRHSVYYDLGAAHRTEMLASLGIHMRDMQKGGFAPVLFREECRFLREIRMEDTMELEACVTQLSRDYRKFGFQQRFLRGEEVCAILRVEGAWFDARARKVAAPPQPVIEAIQRVGTTDDFAWID